MKFKVVNDDGSVNGTIGWRSVIFVLQVAAVKRGLYRPLPVDAIEDFIDWLREQFNTYTTVQIINYFDTPWSRIEVDTNILTDREINWKEALILLELGLEKLGKYNPDPLDGKSEFVDWLRTKLNNLTTEQILEVMIG